MPAARPAPVAAVEGPWARGRVEHLDVLVVGAGISGIGAGRHLAVAAERRSFAILEAREDCGGTWDLFRYPGVRSDSDLYTFGYAFKPWRREESIADGPQILAYLRETVREYGLERHIRYRRRVVGASWSSGAARWTVVVEHTGTGERTTLTCGWLFCAAGYFRYDRGHAPALPGLERFAGPVVHPQHWPAGLDHAGRRVLVVGSGATAVTLVPALAATARHVTMLQRTPTYVMPVPRRDAVAVALKRLFGERRGHALARRRNLLRQRASWAFCRRHPALARRIIRRANARLLPPGYPVDEHFRPPYDPWDQRLCATPDGELFTAIRSGRASVVTDRIEHFTEAGVRLASGRELAADVVVTATGLDVRAFGGLELTVDGRPVRPAETVAYKGVMLSGVPNFVYALGYTNSSWTLKIDLLCAHFGRLLAHMDRHGHRSCRPEPADPAMPVRPLLDSAAGYLRRAADRLPRQGDRGPWRAPAGHREDVRLLGAGPVDGPELRFSR
ncbi:MULTISPECIES: NAD(P)/FAD-dependent oxidoreductase [Kitasatospora]|uniref:Putative oxidoreductase n=1 Tax=Kitasatospora setae (strain ATCC 33774 / DSM 43861 / JCM 3304 / KCC A-0304 / NBRC 14216 / KM-6054) TaxID=452652 RepID=E4N937_KITSK|nr:NAD(P)/FAD-dependent oxidoreductase [Kitasatospora setae]BAJ27718.1 putative oxidoreductase [Kitasatospora setae KM-6054]